MRKHFMDIIQILGSCTVEQFGILRAGPNKVLRQSCKWLEVTFEHATLLLARLASAQYHILHLVHQATLTWSSVKLLLLKCACIRIWEYVTSDLLVFVRCDEIHQIGFTFCVLSLCM